MRALPFEVEGRAIGAGPVQRHAVVAGGGDAQALRREGDTLDAAVLRKFLGRTVGKTHEARSAMGVGDGRSEEHTSELQSLMRISYAVFCLKKKTNDRLIKQNQIS